MLIDFFIDESKPVTDREYQLIAQQNFPHYEVSSRNMTLCFKENARIEIVDLEDAAENGLLSKNMFISTLLVGPPT